MRTWIVPCLVLASASGPTLPARAADARAPPFLRAEDAGLLARAAGVLVGRLDPRSAGLADASAEEVLDPVSATVLREVLLDPRSYVDRCRAPSGCSPAQNDLVPELRLRFLGEGDRQRHVDLLACAGCGAIAVVRAGDVPGTRQLLAGSVRALVADLTPEASDRLAVALGRWLPARTPIPLTGEGIARSDTDARALQAARVHCMADLVRRCGLRKMTPTGSHATGPPLCTHGLEEPGCTASCATVCMGLRQTHGPGMGDFPPYYGRDAPAPVPSD